MDALAPSTNDALSYLNPPRDRRSYYAFSGNVMRKTEALHLGKQRVSTCDARVGKLLVCHVKAMPDNYNTTQSGGIVHSERIMMFGQPNVPANLHMPVCHTPHHPLSSLTLS